MAQIGQQITEDYRDVAYEKTPHGDPAILMVSVLRGAAIYMSDLARQIDLPFEMDYMAVSSYGTGMKKLGVVRILKDLTSNIEGRHVIIAEDIVDSGLTLKYLLRVLESRNPASITIAALLKKQTPSRPKSIASTWALSALTLSSWDTASTTPSAIATCPTSAF